MAWVHLGGDTLACAGDTLTTGTLCPAGKDYLEIIHRAEPCGCTASTLRFNTVSTCTYSSRGDRDASGVSAVSQSEIRLFHCASSNEDELSWLFVYNVPCMEKLVVGLVGCTGGNSECVALHLHQVTGKWVNTPDVTSVQAINIGTGSFNACSDLEVFGG